VNNEHHCFYFPKLRPSRSSSIHKIVFLVFEFYRVCHHSLFISYCWFQVPFAYSYYFYSPYAWGESLKGFVFQLDVHVVTSSWTSLRTNQPANIPIYILTWNCRFHIMWYSHWRYLYYADGTVLTSLEDSQHQFLTYILLWLGSRSNHNALSLFMFFCV